jgi:hypothetical protein
MQLLSKLQLVLQLVNRTFSTMLTGMKENFIIKEESLLKKK